MKAIKFKYYQMLNKLGYNIPKYIIIEYAKYYYLKTGSKIYLGMCDSLGTACSYFDISPSSFVYRIFPKFNPIFCEANNPNYTHGVFWWDVKTKEPRIKAFNKLIKYYKENKEYI